MKIKSENTLTIIAADYVPMSASSVEALVETIKNNVGMSPTKSSIAYPIPSSHANESAGMSLNKPP